MRRWLAVVAGWLALALMQAALLTSVPGSAGSAPAMFALHIVIGLAWALMTPAVAALTQREQGGRASLVLRHLGLLLAAGVVDTIVRRSMIALLGGTPALPWYGTLLYYADRTFVSYVLIVLVARTLDAHDAFVSRQRQALALEAQLARARLASLEERLHPHFLFNTLGAVTELTYEAPARAAHMLRQLASVVRFALERREAEVTLRDEVAALEPYLDVQRTRFADWLAIDSEIDDDVGDVRLPPLLLQPLVENSIRHGLSQRMAAGRILVRASRSGDQLVIEVRDNGVGLAHDAPLDGHGIGLSNMRERLTALYGDDASLRLLHDTDGETVARVTIPVRGERHGIHVAPDDSKPMNRLVVVIVGWALWGLLWTQQSIAYLWFRDRLGERGLLEIALRDFSTSMLWAALTPLMLLCLRWIPIKRSLIVPRLAVHGVAAAGIAMLHGTLAAVLVYHAPVALRTPEGIASVVWGVLAYTIIVTLAHHAAIREWLRERDLAAARLRLNLAEAELGAATARSRPRALLDRLESIARMVEHDPVGAEHDLTRLGDQLRADLDVRVPA